MTAHVANLAYYAQSQLCSASQQRGTRAEAGAHSNQSVPGPSAVNAPEAKAEQRLHSCVLEHWDFVGRFLRHQGVRQDLDDATQLVFITLAQKIDQVLPGKERSFLAGCAVHIAARSRKARAIEGERRGEMPSQPEDGNGSPELSFINQQRLMELDRILAEMDETLSSVFLLYEVEELTMAEIAEALELPPGTVASRLRRARKEFCERVGK